MPVFRRAAAPMTGERGEDRIGLLRRFPIRHGAAPFLFVENPSAGFFGIISDTHDATDAPCPFDTFAGIASTTAFHALRTRNGARRPGRAGSWVF
jgi:hypothetical protein